MMTDGLVSPLGDRPHAVRCVSCRKHSTWNLNAVCVFCQEDFERGWELADEIGDRP